MQRGAGRRRVSGGAPLLRCLGENAAALPGGRPPEKFRRFQRLRALRPFLHQGQRLKKRYRKVTT